MLPPMVLRFRKTVRILPGIRLNVTKKGLSSLSVGGKGATWNIGRKGTRTTVGLPGTGISDTEYHKYDKAEDAGEVGERGITVSWRTLIVIAAIAYAGYQIVRSLN